MTDRGCRLRDVHMKECGDWREGIRPSFTPLHIERRSYGPLDRDIIASWLDIHAFSSDSARVAYSCAEPVLESAPVAQTVAASFDDRFGQRSRARARRNTAASCSATRCARPTFDRERREAGEWGGRGIGPGRMGAPFKGWDVTVGCSRDMRVCCHAFDCTVGSADDHQ